MKRIIRCAGILLLCGALMCPVAEARGRNERGREQPQKTQPASRPGNNGRPSHGNGGGHDRPATPQRPSQPRPDNGRPGNHRPDNNRPGNNRPSNSRPDNNRPGNNRPGNRPGNISGGNHNRPENRPPRPPQAAHRPGHHPGHMKPMPPHHGWFRPAPPPKWRPSHHWRPFRSILGIALGTTINLSINALVNNGYTVSAYDNNTIFVNNVPMLNMMWPEALMFYNNHGGLCGSRFMYPTTYYDMSRYNSTYASLVSAYGAPVSVQSVSGGMESTWWGTGNQFIRLSFASQYDGYGRPGYMTTLSFGN